MPPPGPPPPPSPPLFHKQMCDLLMNLSSQGYTSFRCEFDINTKKWIVTTIA